MELREHAEGFAVLAPYRESFAQEVDICSSPDEAIASLNQLEVSPTRDMYLAKVRAIPLKSSEQPHQRKMYQILSWYRLLWHRERESWIRGPSEYGPTVTIVYEL